MKLVSGALRALAAIGALTGFLLGAMCLGFEALVLAAGGGLAGQSLGQVWLAHDPFAGLVNTGSLSLFGAIIERRISPVLWDPVLLTLINWPSWMALLAAALAFFILAGVLLVLSRAGTS